MSPCSHFSSSVPGPAFTKLECQRVGFAEIQKCPGIHATKLVSAWLCLSTRFGVQDQDWNNIEFSWKSHLLVSKWIHSNTCFQFPEKKKHLKRMKQEDTHGTNGMLIHSIFQLVVADRTVSSFQF